MKALKMLAGIALFLFSVIMILNGANTAIGTSGIVQGTEFGMLIMLTNKAGLIMIWLGLFAVWAVIPASRRSGMEEGVQEKRL